VRDSDNEEFIAAQSVNDGVGITTDQHAPESIKQWDSRSWIVPDQCECGFKCG